MQIKFLHVILILLGICSSSYGSTPKKIPLTPDCIKGAAKEYNIHPDILLIFLLIEGGTVGKYSSNKNNSDDLGLFQINTTHLPDLKQRFGVTREDLIYNGCKSAYMAAYVFVKQVNLKPLPEKIDANNYFNVIARYHSLTPAKNKIYAEKVRRAFATLYKVEQ